jgi:hypothetical protein
LRVASAGCLTVGKPVPLQVVQVCSLIFGVMMNLSGRPQFAASFLCPAKKNGLSAGCAPRPFLDAKGRLWRPSQNYHVGTPALCNFAHFRNLSARVSELGTAPTRTRWPVVPFVSGIGHFSRLHYKTLGRYGKRDSVYVSAEEITLASRQGDRIRRNCCNARVCCWHL